MISSSLLVEGIVVVLVPAGVGENGVMSWGDMEGQLGGLGGGHFKEK
jgi:hypothetical protein